MKSWISSATLWLLFSLISETAAFAIIRNNPRFSSTAAPFSSPTTILELARRRGNLGSIVETGDAAPKTPRTVPKKRSKRGTSTNKKSGTGAAGKDKADTSTAISPLLQQWAASSEEEGQGEETAAPTTTTTTSSGATFARFEADEDQPKKERPGGKKSPKQVQDEERHTLVTGLVQQLQDILESDNKNKKSSDIQDILAPIRTLAALPNANTNLRQLIAGSARYNYRLAWVGSDAAVCHVGTGLHNVPLARLQEIFLSCLGKSRLEVLEVIRIIGPFPNVKNTLEGSCKVGKRNMAYGDNIDQDMSELAITYDAMIDGTGKQITAGVEENVRKLVMHIAFCDENAIVGVVPNEDGSVRQDPFVDNGAHLLFWAKEDVLDDKLEALRVL